MKKLIFLLTIILFAKNLLAEAFYIEHYDVRIHVTSKGVLDVTETLDLFFTEKRHGIIRKIPFRYAVYGNVQSVRSFQNSGSEIQLFLNKFQVENRKFTTSEEGDYVHIKIGDEEEYVEGKQRYVIHYQVYNAVNFFPDHSELYWNVVGQEWDTEIKNATFDLTWDTPIPTSYKVNTFVATGKYGATIQNATAALGANRRSFSGATTAVLNPNEGMTIGVAFPQGFLKQEPIPIEAMANQFYIKNQKISIQILEDGGSEVTEQYTVAFVADAAFIRRLRPIESYQPPSKRDWLGGSYRYLLLDLKTKVDENSKSVNRSNLRLNFTNQQPGTEQNITITYRLYGNFVKKADTPEGMLAFDFTPVYLREPTAQSQVEIGLPAENTSNNIIFNAAISSDDSTQRDVQIRRLGNRFLEANTQGSNFLLPKEHLDFQLLVLQDYFTKSNASCEWWLRWKNNRLLLIPILVFAGLYAIWNRWGRDEPITKMVHYYPPENLSPAEAGILIDDKLHDRDLLALLPYWGARGLIEIREEGTDSLWKKDEYVFHLKAPLPSDAPTYERTMFNGIFGSNADIGDTVKLSSLKYKFHTSFQLAKTQLNDIIKKRSFYMPRTRGGGTFLMVLGFALVLVGLACGILGSAMGRLGFTTSGEFTTPELGLGLLIAGITSLVFGKIMPKKAPLGLALYQQLAGFELFVKDAELPRLETFLQEDPQYFDKTLPYAIVFNHVEKWSKKFEALAVPAPDWYHSTAGNTFSSVLFTHNLSDAMRSMGNTFTSVESSSSSGSSFGGGGGFSGGGFGGGGGSSW